MAFSDVEKTDIRRHCGYPAYGASQSGFQNWRFYQAYGLLEYRMLNMASSEESVVRQYLSTLSQLEQAVVAAAQNLDTERASVWSRNPREVADRTQLFDGWRRRLCAFLGLPAGPGLPSAVVTMVV